MNQASAAGAEALSEIAAADANAERWRGALHKFSFAAALVILGGLLLIGAVQPSADAPLAGQAAPPFDLPGLDGGRISSVSVAGSVTVINVWASWCPPCREEAPAFRRVHARSDPAEVTFLGVVSDDSAASARDFIERFNIDYANVLDENDEFARAYRVRGLPMTFVITRDGSLLTRHFGPMSESRLQALIDDALHRGEAMSDVSGGPS